MENKETTSKNVVSAYNTIMDYHRYEQNGLGRMRWVKEDATLESKLSKLYEATGDIKYMNYLMLLRNKY